jgi:acyl-coenzyme A synthetase/AMP-(fatty) acid ligase
MLGDGSYLSKFEPIRAVPKESSLLFAKAVTEAWCENQVFVAVDKSASDAFPFLRDFQLTPLSEGGGWFDERIELDDPSSPAQISFSSGTTGQPKPIVISRRAVSDTCRRLIEVMRMDDTIREFVGVPLTYSFGLGRVRAIAAVGGKSFLPSNGFRIDDFVEMLAAREVNALSAVPTLLRIIIQQRAKLVGAGSNLRWMEIGSQFMTVEEKTAISDIFPKAVIVQHYGLTEASRTTFLQISRDNQALGSVGRPTGNVRVKIDDAGRICIFGPHLADGVLTTEGLIPTADKDGWLQTSDLGEMLGGNLYFLGRADDLINVGGIKVPAGFFEQSLIEEIQSEAIELAVTGAPEQLRGEILVIAYGPKIDLADLMRAVDVVASQWKLSPSDVQLFSMDTIPRTETGKIRRHEVRSAYEAQRMEAGIVTSDGPTNPDKLHSFYQSLSPRTEIDSDVSFASLKGDSLSYVQATIIIEDALGALPPNWEALTLAELDRLRGGARPARARGWRVVEGEMVSRSFAIALIAASHAWWPDRLIGTSLAGGSTVLLLIFGINLFRFRSETLLSDRPFDVISSIFLRYVLPYYVIIGLFSIKEGFDWRNAALIGTFYGGPSNSLHMYWFFEVLLSLTFIIVGIFCIPALRRLVRERPVASWFSLLAAAIILRVGVEALRRNWGIPSRTPDAFLYLAIGGMAIASMSAQAIRLLIAAFLVVTLIWTAGWTSWPLVFSIGLVPILFFPQISLPSPFASCVRLIASSTIYIYLCGRIVMGIFKGPLGDKYPYLEFTTTLVAGIVIGIIVRFLESRRYLASNFARRVNRHIRSKRDSFALSKQS